MFKILGIMGAISLLFIRFNFVDDGFIYNLSTKEFKKIQTVSLFNPMKEGFVTLSKKTEIKTSDSFNSIDPYWVKLVTWKTSATREGSEKEILEISKPYIKNGLGVLDLTSIIIEKSVNYILGKYVHLYTEETLTVDMEKEISNDLMRHLKLQGIDISAKVEITRIAITYANGIPKPDVVYYKKLIRSDR